VTKQRLLTALGFYALFALLAFVTLEGLPRAAVWVLMGGLAAKTYIAYLAHSRE
jgi:hypothetical protein